MWERGAAATGVVAAVSPGPPRQPPQGASDFWGSWCPAPPGLGGVMGALRSGPGGVRVGALLLFGALGLVSGLSLEPVYWNSANKR